MSALPFSPVLKLGKLSWPKENILSRCKEKKKKFDTVSAIFKRLLVKKKVEMMQCQSILNSLGYNYDLLL